MTAVARLHEDVLEGARQVAALQGRQASDVISDAWQLYMHANRAEIAAELEKRAELLRDGDISGFAKPSGT